MPGSGVTALRGLQRTGKKRPAEHLRPAGHEPRTAQEPGGNYGRERTNRPKPPGIVPEDQKALPCLKSTNQ